MVFIGLYYLFRSQAHHKKEDLDPFLSPFLPLNDVLIAFFDVPVIKLSDPGSQIMNRFLYVYNQKHFFIFFPEP